MATLAVALTSVQAWGQTPSAATSLASANPAEIPVSGTTTITVQLKDASGNNLTSGGATVTFLAPTAGSVGTVADNGNGTYKAVYTAGASAGVVTITPMVNGTNFTSTFVILVGSQYTLNGTAGNNAVGHDFSTNGNLSLNQGFFVDYLLVGGGGGGASNSSGGGGGGGIRSGAASVSSTGYPITIGSGGTGGTSSGAGTNGGSSSAFGLTAGGGLGAPGRNGGNSGSPQSFSGGAGWVNSPGSDGASGGGGAGAGAIGGNGGTNSVGGAGGAGTTHSITGTSVTYAGGGGGGNEYTAGSSTAAGLGGAGGGGNGGRGVNDSGKHGGTATGNGSGGGGGGGFNGNGGSGSGGLAIIRYQGSSVGSVGGTVTSGSGTATGHTLHTFTSSGNFNLSSLSLSTRLGSTLSGVISGSGDLTYHGPGKITLNTNNTYTGQTIITSGTVKVGTSGTSGSLGSGTIELRSGTSLLYDRSDNVSIGNSLYLPGTGIRTLQNEGTGVLTLSGAGSISGQAASPATLHLGGAGSIVLDHPIGSAGEAINLVKVGGGKLTLGSSNHGYTGTTDLEGGILEVNGNSGTGAMTVKTGATLSGAGTVKGATTIQEGGTIMPSSPASQLTIDNGLTLAGGGNYNWKITDATGSSGTGWDHVQVNGTLTVTATSTSKFNINIWSILANGSNGEATGFNPTESSYSWTIITATGGIGNFASDKFNLVMGPANGTHGFVSTISYSNSASNFSVVQDGNSIKLQYDPASQILDGTNDLVINTINANFTTNTLSDTLTLRLGFFADYLLVGGGGGGASNSSGGGGGIHFGATPVSSIDYPITIGSGGAGGTLGGAGTNGGSSSAFGLTAGGGLGAGRSGGNSGSPQSLSGGAGWLNNFGLDGASGGGGAGAGAGGGNGGTNSVGGAGGAGITHSITGTSVTYAGGGGGGNEYTAGSSTAAGLGGAGGGGNGGRGVNDSGKHGGTATGNGSGGGGGGGFNGNGGSGSGGLAIIRYLGSSVGPVGGTVTSGTGTATGYTLHTFTSSGNFSMSTANLGSRLKANMSGNIIGNGNVVYRGPGLLTMTSLNHSYTGSTTVAAGVLRVNGSLANSSGLTVAAGATIGGAGTLPPTVVSGTHAPGNSPGVQTVAGDLTYLPGAVLQWELEANDDGSEGRGLDFDGVDVAAAGQLRVSKGVTAALVFNGSGSCVDFNDTFWEGNHAWLVYDNMNMPLLPSGSAVFDRVTISADKNGLDLHTVPHLGDARFFWSRAGEDIYLNYESGLSSATTASGLDVPGRAGALPLATAPAGD